MTPPRRPMLTIALAVVAALAATAVVASAFLARQIEVRHPPSGRFVDVPGGRLHVADLGPRDAAGPAVLLLHGASGNHLDMRLALGDRLAQRLRVVAPDRPGHGWSDRPGGAAAADPGRQAALIHAGVRALGLERVVVVGHSLAGAVATRYALDYPDAVSGLVLINPATHPWPGGIAWHYEVADVPLLGELFARTLVMPIGLAGLDAAVQEVFAPQPAPPGYAERIAAALVLTPRRFLDNARDVARLLDHVRAQAPRYGAIRAPTVIVVGSADVTVSPAIHAEPLAATVPGARLIRLDGVGHMPHHSHADLLVAEIERLAGAATVGMVDGSLTSPNTRK